MNQKLKKTSRRKGAGKKRAKAKQGRRRIEHYGDWILIPHEKNELHEAIDKAIEKAYRRKGDTNAADPDEIKKNVKEVLELFSRRKRGRRFDDDITAAIRVFKEELKNAGLAFAEYKRLTLEQKRKFWDERIWSTRQAEIITEKEKLKEGRLIPERKRIRDRVTRSFSKSGRKRQRINYRPN